MTKWIVGLAIVIVIAIGVVWTQTPQRQVSLVRPWSSIAGWPTTWR